MAAAAPTPLDLVESVTRLDRAIKDRRETDIELVNWWLYRLLLSWITFGIYDIYVWYKRIARIDAFTRRKRSYYEALLEWTRRQAVGRGREADVREELENLAYGVERAYAEELRPIRPGRAFGLTLLTLGIYAFYVLYRMNRYWWDAQELERGFDDRVSRVWMTLGLTRYPLTYRVDDSKSRSFGNNLLLCFVTLGIWTLVWDYRLHTDPDNLYGELHSLEDTVLQIVRAH